MHAWGADANLFARGVAEVVTDAALTAEPLARPGAVIKRLRGSTEEQLAAAAPVSRTKAVVKPAKTKRPQPLRPDRGAVEAAEAAVADAEAEYRERERRLAEEEAALAERRRRVRADWLADRERLEGERDAAEQRYAAALKTWQDAG